MQTIKKEIKVFLADDGKEFLSEKECKDYEDNILGLKKKIKYYKSTCCPDLTEGRGYYLHVYFAVLDSNYCSFERALKYMIDKYGSPIAYVQGCSPMPNWFVPKESTEEEFNKAETSKVGDYSNKSEQVFISQKELIGFTAPIWIE